MSGFRLQVPYALLAVAAMLLLLPPGPARTDVIQMGPPPAPARPQTIDSTVTIEVRPLAAGVYAAKVSYVWTGWVELPEGILVIDTGFNEEAARALADTIRARSGARPFRYVVNTHAHTDHTGGDRYFGALGANFIAHSKAAKEIQHDLTWAKGEQGDSLTHSGKTPIVKKISRRITYGGTKRPVQVLALGRPAHTAADLVVYLPKQKILFAGDIVSNRSVPWMLDPGMDVNGWLKSLDSLLTFKVDSLVPGHGQLAGPRQGIQFTALYLTQARDKASKVAGWGTTLNEIRQWGYLGPYEGMEFYETVHFLNMRRLYNIAKGIKTPGRTNPHAIKRS